MSAVLPHVLIVSCYCTAAAAAARGLGSNPESLKWFAESERVHARWAMLAVAGILVQVRANTAASDSAADDSAAAVAQTATAATADGYR
jgi:hypothetical protein